MTNTLPSPPAAHQTKIRETLERLGAIKEDRVEIFSSNTRDKQALTVFRDNSSKVIFIDDYYVGDDAYQSGEYRNKPRPLVTNAGSDYEDLMDSERRFKKYRQFIVAKSICDFGCGAGSFLRLSSKFARKVCGVELQKNFSEVLKKDGIDCLPNIHELAAQQDSIFLFHCFEHLPDPISVLEEVHGKLKQDGQGRVIIEVPHARDFLLNQLSVQSFIEFTLWSQHLILHTRESLSLMLYDAGFKEVQIEGVQRYSLSNHINWLKSGRPGGHKESLSTFETDALRESYADALSRIDANDTLVAIATA